MMDLRARIAAFARLGQFLSSYHFDPSANERAGEEGALDQEAAKAMLANAWFTPASINLSLRSIAEMLQQDKLERWLSAYDLSKNPSEKTIAVILAGNIPLVGFHDFLSILITGNHFLGKLSSNDPYLLPALAKILTGTEPGFDSKIVFTRDPIKNFDAVVATGSNNSANYFEYYFSGYPHIIRKNRNSVAVLTGTETQGELSLLAGDVFSYFGLGCRNVSKLFLPVGYDMNLLLEPFSSYSYLIDHHKYNNNYSFQRSILLLNMIPFLDTGYLVLREDRGFASPVGVVFYEFYDSVEKLKSHLLENEQLIQCVVSNIDLQPRPCLPGMAQHPELRDYADGVDTVEFLLSLDK